MFGNVGFAGAVAFRASSTSLSVFFFLYRHYVTSLLTTVVSVCVTSLWYQCRFCDLKFSVELGHTVTKVTEYFVSLQAIVAITEECNALVNDGELTLWPWSWTFKFSHAMYVRCEYFMNQKR